MTVKVNQISAYKMGVGYDQVASERCPSGMVLVVDYVFWSLYPGGGGNALQIEGYGNTGADRKMIAYVPNNITSVTSWFAARLGIPLIGVEYISARVDNYDATGISYACVWYHFEPLEEQRFEEPWIGGATPAFACSPVAPGLCI